MDGSCLFSHFILVAARFFTDIGVQLFTLHLSISHFLREPLTLKCLQIYVVAAAELRNSVDLLCGNNDR